MATPECWAGWGAWATIARWTERTRAQLRGIGALIGT